MDVWEGELDGELECLWVMAGDGGEKEKKKRRAQDERAALYLCSGASSTLNPNVRATSIAGRRWQGSSGVLLFSALLFRAPQHWEPSLLRHYARPCTQRTKARDCTQRTEIRWIVYAVDEE